MDESPIVKPTFDNDEESDTCESDPDPNPNYTVLNDVKEFINHLEMMHDRRIVKNLQSAGLSNFGFDEDDEESYCNLDPKAKMVTGEPLMLACVLYIKDGEQQLRYLAILMCEGADPNETDTKGKTALMYACEYGYEKAVKLLLNHDSINLFHKDHYGNTALMSAAVGGHLNILKLFFKTLRKNEKQIKAVQKWSRDNNTTLSSLALLEAENRNGFNAGMLALENNHFQCVTLIEDMRLKYLKELGKKTTPPSQSSSSIKLDTCNKYQPQTGSCESLHQDKNVRNWREIVHSHNALTKSFAKMKHNRQFQSQQDLRITIEDDQHSDVTCGSEIQDPPSRHHSTTMGGRMKNPDRSGLIKGKHEVKESNMTKSYTEFSLSNTTDDTVSGYDPPNSNPHHKKSFAQGIMSIFKRRQKFRNDRLLNHSVSEIQPSKSHIGSKLSDIEEPKPMRERRKSVDLALRSFHHFIERPTLGKFATMKSEKVHSPSNDVDKSLAKIAPPDGRAPLIKLQSYSIKSTSESQVRACPTVLPPLKSNNLLSPEQKKNFVENFKETNNVLNQLLTESETNNPKIKLSPIIDNNGIRRNKSAESINK